LYLLLVMLVVLITCDAGCSYYLLCWLYLLLVMLVVLITCYAGCTY
jgi:hypothetical protein